jgi:FkbM family methyltransferase
MASLRSALLRAAGGTAGRLPDWMKSAVYKLPVAAPAVRWLLTRAAPGEPVVVEVAAGIARGLWLRVDLKTQKFYWLGTHELATQQALEREVRPGMTVYDIGAHTGFFTLGLARLAGPAGRVYAFEPLPDNARLLGKAVELNGELGRRIAVVEAAVADSAGRVRFHREASSFEGRLSSSNQGLENELEVACVTLDGFVLAGENVRPPELIKLDVEGAEGRVLAGARRVLREVRPVWLIEVHNAEAARAVWEELQQADYAVESLDRRRSFREPSALVKEHILACPR